MGRQMRVNMNDLPCCGQQIIKRLMKAERNQKWLAVQCSVHPSTITLIVLGKASPSLSLAQRICKVLNCGIDDIFGNAE